MCIERHRVVKITYNTFRNEDLEILLVSAFIIKKKHVRLVETKLN